jgi:hypothetical protein
MKVRTHNTAGPRLKAEQDHPTGATSELRTSPLE